MVLFWGILLPPGGRYAFSLSHRLAHKNIQVGHRVVTVKVTFLIVISRERLTSLVVFQKTMEKKQKRYMFKDNM